MTNGCHAVKKLEVTASDIRDISCTGMEDLETLQLGSDSLLSLDISKCNRLVSLNCFKEP